MMCVPHTSTFFFFNDTATTEIYTLSLHDALPICVRIGHEISGQRHESWVCDDCPTWKAPCGLGGWPLPTMADGDALHIARTKASSAVGLSEETKKQNLLTRSEERRVGKECRSRGLP